MTEIHMTKNDETPDQAYARGHAAGVRDGVRYVLAILASGAPVEYVIATVGKRFGVDPS